MYRIESALRSLSLIALCLPLFTCGGSSDATGPDGPDDGGTLQEPESGYFVSPDGSPGGDGSINSPWDLASVLSADASVSPGDTVWLRDGSYALGINFDATLSGTPSEPIVIRGYPGEWARVDGSIRLISPDVWLWGFEVFDSNPSRDVDDPMGIFMTGERTKAINMVVHDHNSNGVGLWAPTLDGEVHGSIIFNNGSEVAHPHGLYTQNDGTVRKRIRNNVIFNNDSFLIHAYGEGGIVRNYEISGNVLFGGSTGGSGGALMIRSDGDEENYEVLRNYVYDDPVTIGWGGNNNNLAVEDNYFVGDVVMHEWINDVSIVGNTIVRSDPQKPGGGWDIYATTLAELQSFDIDFNDYYTSWPGSGPGYVAVHRTPEPDVQYTLSNWQAIGHDSNGSATHDIENLIASIPNAVFVVPMAPEYVDAYEPKRAHVVVYNWEDGSSVSADLSEVLSSGEEYQIRSVQDLAGSPVASGTYDGSPVTIPMTAITPPPWTNSSRAPAATGPRFDAFVVVAGGS